MKRLETLWELEKRLSKLNIKVWKSYDLNFREMWSVERNGDKSNITFINWGLDELRSFVVAVERDHKLEKILEKN